MRYTPEGENNTPLSAQKQRSKVGIIGGFVASAVLSACGGWSDTSERQVTVLDPINVPANSSKDIAVVQVEWTCENPTITIQDLPDGITVGNGVWDPKTNTFTVPVTVDRTVLASYKGEATATILDTCPVEETPETPAVESASVGTQAKASAYAVRPTAYESQTTTIIGTSPIVVKVEAKEKPLPTLPEKLELVETTDNKWDTPIVISFIMPLALDYEVDTSALPVCKNHAVDTSSVPLCPSGWTVTRNANQVTVTSNEAFWLGLEDARGELSITAPWQARGTTKQPFFIGSI